LRHRTIGFAVFFWLVSGATAVAQPPPPPPPTQPQLPRPSPPGRPPSEILQPGELRVYLDCQYECDFDYLRKEITFVDYVRDSQSADIHALVTTETTGGGGWRWKIQFIGLGRFAGHDETMTFTTAQTDSDDIRRRTLARWLRLGLATHAAMVHGKPDLDVVHTEATAAASVAVPAHDPWDNWVFNINTNGNLSGEESSTSASYRVNLSANRVTEAWKFSIGANGSRSTSTFEIPDEPTVESLTSSWSTSSLGVKSLGPKWSAAARLTTNGSTFSNYDFAGRLMGGIEYDVFPYAESTRRSLTFMYMAGGGYYNFQEVTIYDQLSEMHVEHTLGAALGLRQPWGSIGVQSQLSQLLDSPDKYRFNTFGDADVRLFKGFSFNVFGEYSRIRDQFALRKGEASSEEVLLRQRQLATGFSYFVGFGVSYRFGSIYNNVVNPRFRSFF
jgi:hypothetical protein